MMTRKRDLPAYIAIRDHIIEILNVPRIHQVTTEIQQYSATNENWPDDILVNYADKSIWIGIDISTIHMWHYPQSTCLKPDLILELAISDPETFTSIDKLIEQYNPRIYPGDKP